MSPEYIKYSLFPPLHMISGSKQCLSFFHLHSCFPYSSPASLFSISLFTLPPSSSSAFLSFNYLKPFLCFSTHCRSSFSSFTSILSSLPLLWSLYIPPLHRLLVKLLIPFLSPIFILPVLLPPHYFSQRSRSQHNRADLGDTEPGLAVCVCEGGSSLHWN